MLGETKIGVLILQEENCSSSNHRKIMTQGTIVVKIYFTLIIGGRNKQKPKCTPSLQYTKSTLFMPVQLRFKCKMAAVW